MSSWDQLKTKSDKPKSILIPRLNEYIGREEYGNPADVIHKQAVIDGWHPSGMSGFCGRRIALGKLFPETVKPDVIDVDLHKIFNVGTMYHEWYQERYFGPMGILKGIWRCSRCGFWEWGFMPDHPCEQCNWKIKKRYHHSDPLIGSKIFGYWEFMEPWIYDPELNITGHTDGIIEIDGVVYLLEIKTINMKSFGKLEDALPGHKIQSSIYAHKIETNPYVGKPIENIIILYITKDRFWGQPFEKEFHVKLDRKATVPLLSEVGKANAFLREIEELDRALEMEDLPEKKCPDAKRGTAEGCPVVKLCMG